MLNTWQMRQNFVYCCVEVKLWVKPIACSITTITCLQRTVSFALPVLSGTQCTEEIVVFRMWPFMCGHFMLQTDHVRAT